MKKSVKGIRTLIWNYLDNKNGELILELITKPIDIAKTTIETANPTDHNKLKLIISPSYFKKII